MRGRARPSGRGAPHFSPTGPGQFTKRVIIDDGTRAVHEPSGTSAAACCAATHTRRLAYSWPSSIQLKACFYVANSPLVFASRTCMSLHRRACPARAEKHRYDCFQMHYTSDAVAYRRDWLCLRRKMTTKKQCGCVREHAIHQTRDCRSWRVLTKRTRSIEHVLSMNSRRDS